MTATRTALVNGSACSSHAFSSSSSALTTVPPARISTDEHRELLRRQVEQAAVAEGAVPRDVEHDPVAARAPAARRRGGRRARVWMRAASSAKANGLVR